MGESPEEVAELRRRLDMAEDELTFLKAVFEEYKDSSGELEAELDAQLKDLERSNLALKRENEQIRAQLQSTVTRSRKSAEEASNLTSALEAHLEELTKREKKAQTKIKQLEQDLEEAKAQAQAAPPEPQAHSDSVPSAALEQAKADIEKLKGERAEKEKTIAQLKTAIYDARVIATKVAALTQSRFTTGHVEPEIPQLPPEEVDDLSSINDDLSHISKFLQNTHSLLEETAMSKLLVKLVGEMLLDHGKAHEKLDGQSEQAINASCLVILAKVMIFGESLPQFRRRVNGMKETLKGHLEAVEEDRKAKEAAQEGQEDPKPIEENAELTKRDGELAHEVLQACEAIMMSVFDPMEKKQKEEELKKVKEDALDKIEQARLEGERKAKEEADARLAKEKADAEAMLEKLRKEQNNANLSLEEAKKEMERLKQENEVQLQSARTEAKQLAEKARREALEEASVSRKQIEEEVYQSVAGEMDALREALEKSEAQFQQAAMKQQMYQQSMQNAIVDQSKNMLAAMKNAREELTTLKRSAQSELAETQRVLNENLDHVRKVARTIAKSDVAQLSMMYERELDMRVKLQDQVQSLKGNIRVFCRIRPLLSKEIEDGESEAVTQADNMTVVCEDPEVAKPLRFNFDRVFSPDDGQEVVFDEVRTLCLSALDGYNVCLFAYGVTGSGKTFTVEGGENARNNPKQYGLVYRTVKELFRIAFGERAGAYETNIEFQLLELYNEDFRDLLNTDEKAPKPEVRFIPDVGTQVDNVKRVKVVKLDDAMKVVKTGYTNRTTKATNSNSLSSRSHSILTVHLSGENLRTKKRYEGQLHFVDLAGSERVGKSGVQGDALKEAQAINKSLSALGDVISALSKKDKFVPYRNSPLTMLLKESLGGNSKTVMFINTSPCKHSMSETVSSLRFATRAHKVEMGKAQKNESEQPAEVKNIKNKLADIEAKFKTGKEGRMKAPGATPRGGRAGIKKERSPRPTPKGRK